MVERGYGRIIHISSIASFASRGTVGSYNASKGALNAYTKSMAVELGQYNILVNAIAPGFMRTPMVVTSGVDETATPAWESWYVERGKIPLRRVGFPEDIAGTAVFLASPYCRYMTGQLLVVDGGLTSTF
jgi:NAD(P)-dependent dehydrogenase (short-subunit alcohol dehydrogenase family)